MKARKTCFTLTIFFFIFLTVYGSTYILNAEKREILFKQIKPTNILLLGKDNVGNTTDTMMLVRFTPDTNNLFILSLPRDTRISHGSFSNIKLNEVFSNAEHYQYDDPEGEVRDAVSELLDVKVDYSFLFSTDAFVKTIDILGGIEDFYVPTKMYYYDPDQDLDINLYEGKQFIDGKTAEQLMRFRQYSDGHVDEYYDGGDLGRIDGQQRLLTALIEQKVNASVLSKVNTFAAQILPDIRTNMPRAETLRLISSVSPTDFSFENNVKFKTLPGEPQYINGGSYFIINNEETAKIVNKNLKVDE